LVGAKAGTFPNEEAQAKFEVTLHDAPQQVEAPNGIGSHAEQGKSYTSGTRKINVRPHKIEAKERRGEQQRGVSERPHL